MEATLATARGTDRRRSLPLAAQISNPLHHKPSYWLARGQVVRVAVAFNRFIIPSLFSEQLAARRVKRVIIAKRPIFRDLLQFNQSCFDSPNLPQRHNPVKRDDRRGLAIQDRKSTRLNSSHLGI